MEERQRFYFVLPNIYHSSYIYAEVNKKLDKTKGQFAGHEMEKGTKHYVEYLNDDTNWFKAIIIET